MTFLQKCPTHWRCPLNRLGLCCEGGVFVPGIPGAGLVIGRDACWYLTHWCRSNWGCWVGERPWSFNYWRIGGWGNVNGVVTGKRGSCEIRRGERWKCTCVCFLYASLDLGSQKFEAPDLMAETGKLDEWSQHWVATNIMEAWGRGNVLVQTDSGATDLI